MISLPIETAAASCAAIGREPTRLAEPVSRSIERIVEIDESPGISPPSMYPVSPITAPAARSTT